MKHICICKLTIIGSEKGLSPGWCQAIIWTNDGIMLIWPLGRNFSEICTEILTFSFKKTCLKMTSAKWRPFCPGDDELILRWQVVHFSKTSLTMYHVLFSICGYILWENIFTPQNEILEWTIFKVFMAMPQKPQMVRFEWQSSISWGKSNIYPVMNQGIDICSGSQMVTLLDCMF